MRWDTPRLSLKARLIWSYLLILGAGGLITSLVGSWIVSSTIMMQARRAVDHDFATARTVYEEQLQTLKLWVQFAAAGPAVQRYLAGGDAESLATYLGRIRQDAGFDFLTLTDGSGHIVFRASQPVRTQDQVSSVGVVGAALSGKVAAATELVPAALVGTDDLTLHNRVPFDANGGGAPTQAAEKVRFGVAQRLSAAIRPASSSGALAPEVPNSTFSATSPGMALVVAAPVDTTSGQRMGAICGGILLNENSGIVDRVWELLFRGERFKNVDIGLVTIFQGDVRVSGSVRSVAADRAVGSRAPQEVSQAVLQRGELFRGRAFVVNDWYIAKYAPIRNYAGDVIGMFGVGVLENTYTSIRNQVIFSFFGIATVGFLLILGITYYMIRNITRPISEMVSAANHIIAGRFDQEVRSHSSGEIELLAKSFNAMLKSLRQMRADLEEWARTLEEKVKLRTEELVTMQARMAQSDRLASLGMLAAGVAHEINNPLGGILALTGLTVEDLPKDDPNRENLEEVIRQTLRCRDIVKGLLQFSRQSKANTEAVDLNDVLRDTLSLIAKQALFFNIDVVRHLEPELPPVVADRSQFQQVFINILMNAVQAMNEQGTIAINTSYKSADNTVEVAISDTGQGIRPEDIGRIFDPFFTTKSGGRGTGLGLSIAYGIVTTHGGNISVQSEVGRGSTFTIRIPAAVEVRSEL